jgi:hypothetical protein
MEFNFLMSKWDVRRYINSNINRNWHIHMASSIFNIIRWYLWNLVFLGTMINAWISFSSHFHLDEVEFWPGMVVFGAVYRKFLKLPFYPENNSVNVIRIFNSKCSKSQALNDFLQTNSNNTYWVVFGVKR